MKNLAKEFIVQNALAAETLTADEVAPYAEHHSGGLIVLGAHLPDGRYAKVHDSWADEAKVVLHAYDPDFVMPTDDPAADPRESVAEYDTGREALDELLRLLKGTLKIGGVEYSKTPGDGPPDQVQVHLYDYVTVTVYVQKGRELIVEIDGEDNGELLKVPFKVYRNDGLVYEEGA